MAYKMSSLLCRTVARGLFGAELGTARGTSVGRLQSVRHLPVCTVQTNLEATQIPEDFLNGLTKIISNSLSKPEESISISLSTGTAMIRGGTRAGTAIVEIWSIGVFDAERNQKYSEEFIPFLADQLNLPSNRIAVLFHPLKPEEAGHILYRNSQKKQT